MLQFNNIYFSAYSLAQGYKNRIHPKVLALTYDKVQHDLVS
jgi:hypothetical protein